VRDVSLTFETADGKVEALSRINLRIAEGEFVSFIGPSGCGKTTLLRLIADLEQPTLGTLLVNGSARSKRGCSVHMVTFSKRRRSTHGGPSRRT
jgi:ABC-type Fe3+/spermidine/putrescine transport system ATPase subunit